MDDPRLSEVTTVPIFRIDGMNIHARMPRDDNKKYLRLCIEDPLVTTEPYKSSRLAAITSLIESAIDAAGYKVAPDMPLMPSKSLNPTPHISFDETHSHLKQFAIVANFETSPKQHPDNKTLAKIINDALEKFERVQKDGEMGPGFDFSKAAYELRSYYDEKGDTLRREGRQPIPDGRIKEFTFNIYNHTLRAEKKGMALELAFIGNNENEYAEDLANTLQRHYLPSQANVRCHDNKVIIHPVAMGSGSTMEETEPTKGFVDRLRTQMGDLELACTNAKLFINVLSTIFPPQRMLPDDGEPGSVAYTDAMAEIPNGPVKGFPVVFDTEYSPASINAIKNDGQLEITFDNAPPELKKAVFDKLEAKIDYIHILKASDGGIIITPKVEDEYTSRPIINRFLANDVLQHLQTLKHLYEQSHDLKEALEQWKYMGDTDGANRYPDEPDDINDDPGIRESVASTPGDIKSLMFPADRHDRSGQASRKPRKPAELTLPVLRAAVSSAFYFKLIDAIENPIRNAMNKTLTPPMALDDVPAMMRMIVNTVVDTMVPKDKDGKLQVRNLQLDKWQMIDCINIAIEKIMKQEQNKPDEEKNRLLITACNIVHGDCDTMADLVLQHVSRTTEWRNQPRF